MIEVSVVMGVYNAEAVLAGTLDSILSQEGCDFEFIVVDDGSRDGTAGILRERAARDSRLKVIRQDNAGLTSALIAGCAAARGEFIARQDAGDLSSPGRLAKQAAALRAEAGLAFVSCVSRYVDADGDTLYEVGAGSPQQPASIIDLGRPRRVTHGPSSHPSVMFRRSHYERVGGYRREFYFSQDWDLWFRLAQVGTFQLLPEPLVTICLRPGDISMLRRPMQVRYWELAEQCLRRRLEGQPESDLLALAPGLRAGTAGASAPTAAQAAAASYFFGDCLRRNEQPIKAAAYFRQALRSHPLHLKAWARLVQTTLQAHFYTARSQR